MAQELPLSEVTGKIGEIKWLVQFLQFKIADYLVAVDESISKVDLILL